MQFQEPHSEIFTVSRSQSKKFPVFGMQSGYFSGFWNMFQKIYGFQVCSGKFLFQECIFRKFPCFHYLFCNISSFRIDNWENVQFPECFLEHFQLPEQCSGNLQDHVPLKSKNGKWNSSWRNPFSGSFRFHYKIMETLHRIFIKIKRKVWYNHNTFIIVEQCHWKWILRWSMKYLLVKFKLTFEIILNNFN